MDDPVVMILGPTASGKTALSLEVARRAPVEIVSVDSALVYRGMDIGTAKPTAEERSLAPHHLMDVREIDEPYSVADFVADADRLVPEIRARGRLPLLVGGTMLYAASFVRGLASLPTSTPEARAAVAREAAEVGWPAMRERLAAFDPVTAGRLMPNDSQRIARAIEVHRMTGRTMAEFLAASAGTSRPPCAVIALLPRDRAALHQRIAERFDAMIEAGFVDEVRRLMESPGFDERSSAMRSVGYRQAVPYIRGETTFSAFRDAAVAATRQLAKRQITWLRGMREKTVIYVEDLGDMRGAAELVLRTARNAE